MEEQGTIFCKQKGNKDVKLSNTGMQRLPSHSWRNILALVGALCLVASTFGPVTLFGATTTPVLAAGSLPCDIYASGSTPCVAAHSTVRALYGGYNSSLYQVRRASDNTTMDIGVLSTGGYANAAAQDSFCAGTSCVITIIYDQSGRGNNLTQAPPGGFSGPAAGGYDNLAYATAAPITVNGHEAYGVYVVPGTGYRNDHTNGIATGDNPEGEYAVVDGTHYNHGCCFDYGNAETDAHDDGNGTMETIYFGKGDGNTNTDGGPGSGPWVMTDQENGLYSGVNPGYNSGDQTVSSRFVTAMMNGGPNLWAIKAGNAQSGGLTTMYSGPRPNVSGYNPMHKQGAIILGIGGDNSNGSAGTFYEGVMTSGYPSDATENAVQASIVAAGYSTSAENGTSGAIHAPGGTCVDVQAANSANGTPIQLYDCNNTNAQKWTVLANGTVQALGKCLDIIGNGTAPGSKLQIWDCDGVGGQQWVPQANGSLFNPQSGICLDDPSGNTANGTQLQIWTCNNSLASGLPAS